MNNDQQPRSSHNASGQERYRANQVLERIDRYGTATYQEINNLIQIIERRRESRTVKRGPEPSYLARLIAIRGALSPTTREEQTVPDNLRVLSNNNNQHNQFHNTNNISNNNNQPIQFHNTNNNISNNNNQHNQLHNTNNNISNNNNQPIQLHNTNNNISNNNQHNPAATTATVLHAHQMLQQINTQQQLAEEERVLEEQRKPLREYLAELQKQRAEPSQQVPARQMQLAQQIENVNNLLTGAWGDQQINFVDHINGLKETEKFKRQKVGNIW